MTISSRDPDEIPRGCPVCGQGIYVEPLYLGGDSCCDNCRQLFRWIRDRLSRAIGMDPRDIGLYSSFAEHVREMDSLEFFELLADFQGKMA